MEKIFLYHISALEKLLNEASKSKNAAQYLHENKARNVLFMLEALARLFKNLHNKKKFTKIQTHIKLLEDNLGQIDFYESGAKSLLQFKELPTNVLTLINLKCKKAVLNLNKILIDNDWLNQIRIKKIKEKLSECDWTTNENYAHLIKVQYQKEINTIFDFHNSINKKLSTFETGVHELRRKLRWLSIYPQALQGFIQYNKPLINEKLSIYQTNEITNSPFNTFVANKSTVCMKINQRNFHALSWMILCLGNIKDLGLNIHLIKESITELKLEKNEEKINKLVADIFSGYAYTEASLLHEANEEFNYFLKTNALNELV